MDKQKKLKVALPILIVVLIIVWGPQIIGKGKTSGDKAKEDVILKEASRGSAQLLSAARSNERRMTRTTYSEWGRDPFRPVETPKASVIEGIMWDENNPKAIINGSILGVGDETGSGQIVEIRPNSVFIKVGTETLEFSLRQ